MTQVAIDDEVFKQIDEFLEVDTKKTFRSKTHFISVACLEKLDQLKKVN